MDSLEVKNICLNWIFIFLFFIGWKSSSEKKDSQSLMYGGDGGAWTPDIAPAEHARFNGQSFCQEKAGVDLGAYTCTTIIIVANVITAGQ